MPLLQMLATVQEEQSLGHLQELTSPVLGKLKEALIFTRLASAQRRAFGSRTVVLDGQYGSFLTASVPPSLHLFPVSLTSLFCRRL